MVLAAALPALGEISIPPDITVAGDGADLLAPERGEGLALQAFDEIRRQRAPPLRDRARLVSRAVVHDDDFKGPQGLSA